MQEWEKKFDALALSKGIKVYREGKVENIQKTENLVTAIFPGIHPYEVNIILRDGKPVRMKCQCPKAKGGSNCEHMAAVCCAVYGISDEPEKVVKEKEKPPSRALSIRQEAIRKAAEKAAKKAAEQEQAIKEAKEAARKKQEEERARKKAEKVQAAIARRNQEKAEDVEDIKVEDVAEVAELVPDDYSYFDFAEIRKSMKLFPEEVREGEKLYREGKIEIEKFLTGYLDNEEDMVADLRATSGLGQKFPIRMVITRTKIRFSECRCPECRKSNYWFTSEEYCSYKVAMLYIMEDYVKYNRVGDATDRNGMQVLNSFLEQHATQVIADSFEAEETLKLVPRLQHQSGRLMLSFKVGSEKLYVIKDLFQFSQQVRDCETVTYGNNTKMNHRLSNFTQEGQAWAKYIQQIVLEEAQVETRLSENGWYYGRKGNKHNALELYGWKLDQFYMLMGKRGVDYEKRFGSKKEKHLLYCKEAVPKVKMEIQKNKVGNGKEFHGIQVSCTMPVFLKGAGDSYFIENQYLCKVKAEQIEGFRLLTDKATNGRLDFKVGRNNLSEFYYRMLAELSDSVEILEHNAEEIHSYLPPDVEFLFYLDAQDHNITCRLHARYGEHEVSVFDVLNKNAQKPLERFRMHGKELEMFHITKNLFPEIDIPQDELHCGRDEECMYYVLEHGVETLMEYGEVQCTERFRSKNVIKKLKVTVGISVSSGLLDLDIDTQDISRAELLDVLKSYRLRKKFYRLENGDFVKLEDNTIEMLGELMDSMRMSPKEFVKGKMHLPIYRTLYLDKLLEENENIYSTRDSHFREIVKNFKTVNEADYEEPASLSEIMRGYQKKGYRWLRTLESCQFGGILADDMGLGKTLQAIAMLLAAKEEGRAGTSLVVSPSSLVYNWGEELQRFAPQLNVLIVTGNQSERQQKLKEYSAYDVLVTSYDLLKRDITLYEDIQFMYEIIDEAQYIKNHTTAVSKAVKVIHSQYRYAMTGTPIENRLSELWSIFDYLMPGFLYSYDIFKREFETPIVKNGDEEALKRLQKMVGAFILRRLKSDVLKDLPDKLEEIRYVQMENDQKTVYEAQVVHMQAQIASQDQEEFSKNKMQILAELMKLRQICCDPSLCFENYGGASAKLEGCLELIQSAIDGGHKLLLFSQFTSMLDILQQRLTACGIKFYIITGGTAKEKRLQMVKSFNEDDTPVFLISLKAGGVGLNLTGADVVIHYDPWWNQAVQNQATDRAHRIGQTKKVTVYKLIMKHSIEEKIQKLQEAKMDLADQIVNGQGSQIGGMSQKELLELLES